MDTLLAQRGVVGTVSGMIRLTRLRKADQFWLNPDHIERLERHHETVVRLDNGTEYVVQETPEEIVQQMMHLRARAIALAARLTIEGLDVDPLDGVRAAAISSPMPEIGPPDQEEAN
jgi:uncharacterized protein YlzI (FlbEa/FlbD family)